ncbi:MAG: hypothetical protein JWM88_1313 [Verrucomicrobia bacterium]|nr:hypothetical protein [Verrucomicrobiota bacterium]
MQSVIVYQGPGAWKKEAYWDEYVLTFLNPGADPLVIDSLTIVDALNQKQSPGSEPWTLEESSRQNLKKFEHHGRRIFLGVGLSVAWGMAPAAALGGALGGSSALALAGLTAFFAIPAIVVTHVIVNKHARRDIQAEFERRRLPLPLALPPQGIMTGSVFFPISPGPQRLQIAAHRDSEPFTLVVDLLPLAGLHLFKAPEKPGSAPVPATNP